MYYQVLKKRLACVVEMLHQLGHYVLTTKAPENANKEIPDEEVLHFAIAEERIVLTFNYNHFKRLHHFLPDHLALLSVPKTGINKPLRNTKVSLPNRAH